MLEYIVNLFFGIGLFINALLFIPQLLLLLKSKHADDVSLTMFLGFAGIQLFTIFHGLYTHDWLLVIGYLLSLGMCLTISCLILWYRACQKVHH